MPFAIFNSRSFAISLFEIGLRVSRTQIWCSNVSLRLTQYPWGAMKKLFFLFILTHCPPRTLATAARGVCTSRLTISDSPDKSIRHYLHTADTRRNHPWRNCLARRSPGPRELHFIAKVFPFLRRPPARVFDSKCLGVSNLLFIHTLRDFHGICLRDPVPKEWPRVVSRIVRAAAVCAAGANTTKKISGANTISYVWPADLSGALWTGWINSLTVMDEDPARKLRSWWREDQRNIVARIILGDDGSWSKPPSSVIIRLLALLFSASVFPERVQERRASGIWKCQRREEEKCREFVSRGASRRTSWLFGHLKQVNRTGAHADVWRWNASSWCGGAHVERDARSWTFRMSEDECVLIWIYGGTIELYTSLGFVFAVFVRLPSGLSRNVWIEMAIWVDKHHYIAVRSSPRGLRHCVSQQAERACCSTV